jgi:hypothetical protein
LLKHPFTAAVETKTGNIVELHEVRYNDDKTFVMKTLLCKEQRNLAKEGGSPCSIKS